MTAPAQELPSLGKAPRHGFQPLESAAETTKGELPVGWRWMKLGDCCKVYAGGAAPQERRHFDNGGPCFFRVSDLGRHGRTSELAESQDHLSEVALKECHLVHAKKGTVLFPKSGAAILTNNRAVLAADGYIVSHLMALEPESEIISEWLYHALCQIDMMKFSDNSGYPSLKQTEVERIEIPLPPLPEQKRIAAILREQMAAAEKARAASQARLEAADVLLSAFMRSVFEGPEAAQWPLRPLGEVLVPHKEIIHPGDRQSGTATFVGLEHIESDTGRRIGEGSVDLAHLTGRKPTFRRGQIVYGYLRPYLNKVWIAEFDGVSSVDQFAYEVRGDVADVRFVAWFMRSPTYMRRSQVLTTTGQLPRIGTGEIAAVEIGLPSIEVQRAVADEIDWQFAAHQGIAALLSEEAEAIERMPAALLRQAFSGKQ